MSVIFQFIGQLHKLSLGKTFSLYTEGPLRQIWSIDFIQLARMKCFHVYI